MFGHVFEQTDNNLMVMQIAEEVAPKFGLRTLLAEKPFAGKLVFCAVFDTFMIIITLCLHDMLIFQKNV